ncbi:MAG: nucleotidyltransferase domain-containing protein [Crenarchaeota archaeon]|nr:nucleotidyltransferase domain-containing protein [Thermoproteota archaeon]MDW8034115.1 nucleotidyltransferase domain-containing protein [Nitrososphaerota archaeon]
MQRKYSNSVRVFFPKFSLEDVVKEVERCVYLFSERLALKKVILFGSYAKKRYTVASDIDLLVVFDNSKCTEDEVYKTLRKNIKIPRLELHILPMEEYNMIKGSKWIKTINEEGVKIL